MGQDVPTGALTKAPSRREAPAGSRRPVSTAREYVEVVLVAVVFALFVRTFLVQAFVVPTPSMENTVLVGDHLVVNKFIFAPHLWGRFLPYRELKRGDVFVFKFPEDPQRDFIKRAIALPGDVLEIHDKVVYVNGETSPDARAIHAESRIWRDDRELPEALRRRDQLAPMRIGASSYFALGDNRDSSYDSRFWGPVPASNVKGRALFIYWSLAPPALAKSTGFAAPLKDLLQRTRWSRTFLAVR